MLKAVVFDLDGTITRPLLDFKRIREEIGPLSGIGTLLDQMNSLPEPDRRRAHAILERHEREAADNAEKNYGIDDLLALVFGAGLKTGILTRNSAVSTDCVLQKLGLSFHEVITRDSGLPLKPDPAPLIELARRFSARPEQMLMVGDFLYDVQCGKGAGTRTCLITNGHFFADGGGADFTVTSPGEAVAVLRSLIGGNAGNGDYS